MYRKGGGAYILIVMGRPSPEATRSMGQEREVEDFFSLDAF